MGLLGKWKRELKLTCRIGEEHATCEAIFMALGDFTRNFISTGLA
jgi:hypothetical protein